MSLKFHHGKGSLARSHLVIHSCVQLPIDASEGFEDVQCYIRMPGNGYKSVPTETHKDSLWNSLESGRHFPMNIIPLSA